MPRSTPKYQIQLTPEQVESLTTLSRTHTAPFAEVQRAHFAVGAPVVRQCGDRAPRRVQRYTPFLIASTSVSSSRM